VVSFKGYKDLKALKEHHKYKLYFEKSFANIKKKTTFAPRIIKTISHEEKR
jgi:hypothetical protein